MKVGFIGSGAMGRPMIGHLLRAGHDVYFYARRPEVSRALVAEGAIACDSPARLAAEVGVVFTIVTTDADVAEVCFGPAGLIDGLAPDSIVVDMSTIAPGNARTMAERLARQGVHRLDAPVSGGEVGARAATLAFMVGGPAQILERVRPLLLCLGRSIVHVGEHGAGQVAKMCNQAIMVAAIEACAEAFALADAAGVNGAKVLAALAPGSAGSRVLEVMGARMVAEDYQAGIEARLHHKDFRILMAEAHTLGLPMPIAAQVWQQLNALMAHGWGRNDTAILREVIKNRSPAR